MLTFNYRKHTGMQQWLYLLVTLVTAVCPQEGPTSPTNRCSSDSNGTQCPHETELGTIHSSLLSLVARAENITDSLAEHNASIQHVRNNCSTGDVHEDLRRLQEDLRALSEKVLVLTRSPRNESSTDPGKDQVVSDQVQTPVDGLWQELQNLTNTVSQLLADHSQVLSSQAQMTFLSNGLGDLKRQVTSTNEKLTNLSVRYDALLAQLNCLKDNLKKQASAPDKQTLADQLKAHKKAALIQSTLHEKTNTIGQQDVGDNSFFFKHMLEIQETNEGRLLNLTSAIVDVEKELLLLRLNYSQRLRDVEVRLSESLRPSTVAQASQSALSSTPITRSSCRGLRRHLVGDSCYYVPRLKETDLLYTWWDARYVCKQPDVLGPQADLVSINSKEEMDAIRNLVTNHFGGMEEFWLGGNDLETEGHWVWSSSGTALDQHSYTNWGREPRHTIGQNCMSMLRGFVWAAEACFYQRYPFCELKLT